MEERILQKFSEMGITLADIKEMVNDIAEYL